MAWRLEASTWARSTSPSDLNSPEVSPDQLAAAERLACEVVFQNRPVEAKFWDPQSIDWSRLRKPTSRTENIRLVGRSPTSI